jgi:hypothetical protein
MSLRFALGTLSRPASCVSDANPRCAAYGIGMRVTRHPARVAAKLLKVTGAGTN